MFGLEKVLHVARHIGCTVRKYANILRREWLVEHYVRAGARFGDAIHQHFMGACVDLEGARRRWERLERHYADLGYRTISIPDFVEIGAYGRGSEDLIRVWRAQDEEPILYAKAFQKRYETGFAHVLDLEHIMMEDQHCGKHHHSHPEGDWEAPRD